MRGAKAIDMTGFRTGMLTVLHDSGKPSASGTRRWVCRCDCGGTTVVASTSLRRHNQKSCGCIVRTHRMSRTPTYKSWQAMWQRCTNPNIKNYERYGAKGVTICERWETFEAFVEDMGPRPEGTSLDRINTFGNYEPGNCRWATRAVQDANTRRSLGYVTLDGDRISVSEMAHRLAMTPNALYYRFRTCRDSEMRLGGR